MDQEHQKFRAEVKHLPIHRTETSLIKDEFDSLRARFDAETRNMEMDMVRFRSQMESSLSGQQRLGASSKFSTTSKSKTSSGALIERTSTASTTTSKTTSGTAPSNSMFTTAPQSQPEAGPGQTHDWLDDFAKSPIVVSSTSDSGDKEEALKLRFDVSAYEPDQIVVKTFDDRLQVYAKRKRVNEHEVVSSEYNREFLLPEGVDRDSIKSSLSVEGILTVEVPLTSKPVDQ